MRGMMRVLVGQWLAHQPPDYPDNVEVMVEAVVVLTVSSTSLARHTDGNYGHCFSGIGDSETRLSMLRTY